ncbi:MAG TPA: GNAT family N-acetyltransferase [Phycisphaerae bacterium]|nr:GNAT family N-acetyltransferase [Phycisphaerae bacterium]HRY68312.1 GNAT family N-acetyltransferase [Phycisphaerae bacterium]HSA26805.1 GNAT family N-acetyltransferase [Phycisphaerae bacterium]
MTNEKTHTRFALVPMTACHGDAVVEIFNHYVSHSFAAYPEQPVPGPFFDQLLQATQGYPAFVVVDETRRVTGFACLRPLHPASSLCRAAEVTCFIAPDSTRQGVGTAMLRRLIEQATPMGIDSLVASISVAVLHYLPDL